jgi:hypothetical protein
LKAFEVVGSQVGGDTATGIKDGPREGLLDRQPGYGNRPTG